MDYAHQSVLLEASIGALRVAPGGLYIDGTLGGGGHSAAILEKSAPDGRLFGIDRDREALASAGKRLAVFGDRARLFYGNFADMETLVGEAYAGLIDGVLLDLGVSSHQIDDPSRGFSYMNDAPLDMRMDKSAPLSAETVVNTYSEAALCGILTRYGEERWAARIAQFIVRARAKSPVETTGRLEEIVLAAVPAGARRDTAHPARRTFQAIRIEVNGELDAVDAGIRAAARLLKPGGRLCVITFHSLEDHLVKDAFRQMENPCVCPRGAPVCTCGRKPMGKMLGRKPILPAADELAANPRAHSAHLRVFERNENPNL